jgi:hypothetical protein
MIVSQLVQTCLISAYHVWRESTTLVVQHLYHLIRERVEGNTHTATTSFPLGWRERNRFGFPVNVRERDESVRMTAHTLWRNEVIWCVSVTYSHSHSHASTHAQSLPHTLVVGGLNHRVVENPYDSQLLCTRCDVWMLKLSLLCCVL